MSKHIRATYVMQALAAATAALALLVATAAAKAGQPALVFASGAVAGFYLAVFVVQSNIRAHFRTVGAPYEAPRP